MRLSDSPPVRSTFSAVSRLGRPACYTGPHRARMLERETPRLAFATGALRKEGPPVPRRSRGPRGGGGGPLGPTNLSCPATRTESGWRRISGAFHSPRGEGHDKAGGGPLQP